LTNQYSIGGTDACVPCPTGCTTCLNASVCITCNSGYGFGNDLCTQCLSN
jgi:hypothetical protein